MVLLHRLAKEKMPYLVTLLFGALGWGATHTVDRLLESPIIEYTTWAAPATQFRIFSLSIYNVSQKQAFNGLTLVFLLPKGSGKFLPNSARIVASPPAWEGEAAPDTRQQSIIFTLPTLHPDGQVRFEAGFEGDTLPAIRLSTAVGPVRLVPPSLETFLVKHELCVLIGMMLFWALCILVLLLRPDTSPSVPEGVPPPWLSQRSSPSPLASHPLVLQDRSWRFAWWMTPTLA
jgi:hypothetical protein